MARTPALSVDEAEAACVAAYGPRAQTISAHSRITAETRGPIRAWLTAQGIPSDVARGLSLTLLRDAWTDTTGACLTALRRIAAEGPTNTTTQEPATVQALDLRSPTRRAPPTIEHEPEPVRAPIVSAMPTDTNAAAAQIGALLAQHFGTGAVNPDQVRAIVAEAFDARRLPTADELAGMVAAAVAAAHVPSALTITVADRAPVTLPAARHSLTETCVQIAAQNIPLCLVGPAGAGKTSACEMVAKALSLPFYMDGAPSGSHVYLGFVDAGGRYHTTPFRQAFEHGGVYLADELDGATDPAAPLTLNAALANGCMAFPDAPEPVKRHPDFRMIAACNTYGTGADRVYVGRVQLDGSTLDRFAFLEFGYDTDLERALCANADWLAFVHRARAAVLKLSLRHIVSTRAAIMGATLLAAGLDRATVETLALWKGLPAADVSRVRNAMDR